MCQIEGITVEHLSKEKACTFDSDSLVNKNDGKCEKILQSFTWVPSKPFRLNL